MDTQKKTVQLGLPKGRIQQGVEKLLTDAGIQLRAGSRTYRPKLSLPDFEAKVLKPQNIAEMVAHGSRDIGFTGVDWVEELEADVVELLDTELDPVRIVLAAPAESLVDGKLPKDDFLIASEYEVLTKNWIRKNAPSALFVRSYGATEVFPPEDADAIVDNTSSGATLKANGLKIISEVMTSSTRLFANPRALENKEKREKIEDFVMLLKGALSARSRVMLEVNVSAQELENVVELLPAMREVTVASLHGEAGYAIRAAIPKNSLATLIPQIKNRGGTDVVISNLCQIIP